MLRSASFSAETICAGVSALNITLSLYIFVPYELSSSSSLLELPLLQEMSAPPQKNCKG
ncbi:hypothetical protein [Treponema sp. UBA6852]|uniref:hypothetical protein n=1 Tax=Treponema sp. UBA6852 TaxID=1947744 RepID=UPI0025CB8348|nr:hypothetical protein [Treponema sp. UBA6852]